MTSLSMSFLNAFKGLRKAWAERNFRIELTVAVLVVIAGFVLHLSAMEFVALFLAIGLVLGAEAMNTAVERLSDVVSPNRQAEIEAVKDIMAGAVLLSAVSAAVIGLIIFGQIFWQRL